MLLDTMACRYHKLPSELLSDASTIDLFIMNQALSFYRRQEKGAKVNSLGGPQAPELSQEEMMRLLKQTKGKN